jgi:hypothetical protein
MKEWAPLEVETYKQRYKAASSGSYDIYVVFVEKGLSLLNDRGRLGFILPSKFFATDYGEALRLLITERRALSEIVDFGHAQVFENATTYTCLLFLSATPKSKAEYRKVTNPPELMKTDSSTLTIESETLASTPWIFATDVEKLLADKLTRNGVALGEVPARIGRGSSSGADEVFMLQNENGKLFTRQGSKVEVEKDVLRVPIYATDFGRYRFAPESNEVIIFPYKVSRESYELIEEAELHRLYPKTYKYLASRRNELETRKQFKAWYGFSAPRNLDVHGTAQILVPLLADRGLYCRLPTRANGFCLMASGGFSITIGPASDFSPNYVLGLLNSKLLYWRLRSISNLFRGGWITCTKQYVETLPIRRINFSDPADKAQHDRVVSSVEQMLDLHKRLAAAQDTGERERLQRLIDSTDQQIDALVYELYGLTPEEIEIVEGRSA